MWLGEFDVSSIIDFKFPTRNTSGVLTTLAGTPAISVYKANGTTESTSGVTLTTDFDSRTGMHHIRIDTSSDGTFYATGNDFQVVITAGTVGGTSVVGEVVGFFTLRNRAGLKPTTAGRTLDVDSSGRTDLGLWLGSAPDALSSGKIPADLKLWLATAPLALSSQQVQVLVNALAADSITASAIATDAIGSAELAASAVTEIQSGLSTLTSANVEAAVWDSARASHTTAGTFGQGVASVQGNVTGSAASVTGAVGSVTGNVGGNVVGSVASVTADVGITQTGADKVWGSASRTLSSFGTLVSDVTTAVWNALTSGLTTASSIGKLLVDNLNATIGSRLAASSYTVPPDVNAIADQVWDEALAGHLTAGSTGAGLNAAGSAGDPWNTALPGSYGAGSAGNILGNNLNAAVGTRSTQASVDTIAGYVDTEVAAIKAKTDLLSFTGTDVKATLDGETVALDLTAALDTSNDGDTVGGALLAARAQGFGKWSIVGTALTLYASDGTTIVKTFTLDDANSPTSRTEV